MSSPTLRLFTFKDGLLSRLGHDLQFTVRRYVLTLEGGQVRGRFEADSLLLEGVVKRGKLDPKALSESDQRKVLKSALHEVLEVGRYPEIVLEAAVERRGDGVEIRGSLTLQGQRRALPRVRAVALGDRLVISLEIEPSRWGIRPYRALAGALKLKDRVGVELSVPTAGDLDPSRARRWQVGLADQGAPLAP